MNYYEKKRSFEKLAEEILEDGDVFTIRKNNGKVVFDSDSPDTIEKSYKTRAILKKYNRGYLRFYGAVSTITLIILLSIFVQIRTSKSEFDNWVVYLGLFILYGIIVNKIRKTIHYIYIRFNWKKLRSDLQDIPVNNHYLQNEYGDNSEFEELITNIIARFDSERKRRSYNTDF